MKKIIFSLFLFAFALTATAQSVRFGATGNVTLDDERWASGASKFSYAIGAKAEWKFAGESKGWFSEASLLFASKPYTVLDSYLYFPGAAPNASFDVTSSSYRLELPIGVGYKFKLAKSFSLYGSAGPTISYGLGGKLKGKAYTFNGTSYVFEENLTFSEGFYSLFGNRLNLGLNVNIGAELFKHYQISFGFDLPLTNELKDVTQKHKSVKLGIAYVF